MKYLAFIFLLLSFSSRSQSLQGIVTDMRTHKPLYPVTVVNVFTQQTTSTDEKGVYSIPAKTGDLVAFTYIGYKSVQKAKPPSVLIATLNVALEPTGYQLEEFKLRPGHLTQYQMDSAERASIYKVPLQRAHPSPVMSPFSAVAEKFSRRAKMVYRFQKNFRAGEIEKFIDTRYTPDLVTTLTSLEGDSLGHFMYAYPMAYDFARLATDLEIKMWIRLNYKEWISKPAADTVGNKH